MPGGWTMSMAWMRMPGQTWPGAATSFLGMWVVMMVAMMLPSLVLMLSAYRRSLGRSPADRMTALAGAGYFAVWTLFGAAVYPLGVALAAGEMAWPSLARAVPILTGVVLVLAGGVQLSGWKARQLERCRGGAPCGPPGSGGAFRYGVDLGIHCCRCCSGYMLVLLVAGVMDLRAMAAVGAAITAERLGPWPERVARVTGALVLAAGIVVIARALWRS